MNALFTLRKNERGELPLGVTKVSNGYLAICNVMGIPTKTKHSTVTEAFESYKQMKYAAIRMVADKWKPELCPDTYNALLGWKIEVTD
ncbi:hypothetical protein D3C85_1424820 [compost metagenome]